MTNEPTTGETVRALRYCTDINSICGDACPAHLDEAGCRTVLMENAADRLEQQEQRIADLERDLAAAKEDIHHNDACSVCIGAEQEVCKDCDCECLTCVLDCRCKDCRDESKWEWRGAREGEG